MRLVDVLPFVPGDVDHPVGPLRVVEQLEHAAGALHARLHPALALSLQQRRVDGVGALPLAIAHRRDLRSGPPRP